MAHATLQLLFAVTPVYSLQQRKHASVVPRLSGCLQVAVLPDAGDDCGTNDSIDANDRRDEHHKLWVTLQGLTRI